MSLVWVILDCAVLALSVLVFGVNLRAYRWNRQRVGRLQAHWRIRFNFAFPGSGLMLALLLVLVAAEVGLLLGFPRSVHWLDGLAVIGLSLAFFPRYNFVDVGTEGILVRWVFYPWTSVREKRLVEDRGRKYLELGIASESGQPSAARIQRIRVPRNVSLVLD